MKIKTVILTFLFMLLGMFPAYADCVGEASFSIGPGAVSTSQYWIRNTVDFSFQPCPYFHPWGYACGVNNLTKNLYGSNWTKSGMNYTINYTTDIGGKTVTFKGINTWEGYSEQDNSLWSYSVDVRIINPYPDWKYISAVYHGAGKVYGTYYDKDHRDHSYANSSYGSQKSVAKIYVTHDTIETITKQPTTTSTGIKHISCSCGETSRDEVIPALHTHSYTTFVSYVTAPTCTAAGVGT